MTGLRVGSYVKAAIKASSPDLLKSGESRHVTLQLLSQSVGQSGDQSILDDKEDPNKGVLSFAAKRDFGSLLPGHRLKGKIT